MVSLRGCHSPGRGRTGRLAAVGRPPSGQSVRLSLTWTRPDWAACCSREATEWSVCEAVTHLDEARLGGLLQ